MPGVIAKKINNLVELLNLDTVNTNALKNYLAEGIPDEAATVR